MEPSSGSSFRPQESCPRKIVQPAPQIRSRRCLQNVPCREFEFLLLPSQSISPRSAPRGAGELGVAASEKGTGDRGQGTGRGGVGTLWEQAVRGRVLTVPGTETLPAEVTCSPWESGHILLPAPHPSRHRPWRAKVPSRACRELPIAPLMQQLASARRGACGKGQIVLCVHSEKRLLGKQGGACPGTSLKAGASFLPITGQHHDMRQPLAPLSVPRTASDTHSLVPQELVPTGHPVCCSGARERAFLAVLRRCCRRSGDPTFCLQSFLYKPWSCVSTGNTITLNHSSKHNPRSTKMGEVRGGGSGETRTGGPRLNGNLRINPKEQEEGIGETGS